MKSYLITLSAGLLLTLAGCGKKNDPSPSAGGGVGTSSLKVSISGESDFVSNDTDVVADVSASSDPTETPAIMFIRAQMGGTDHNLYMVVDKFTGPGTYQFKIISDNGSTVTEAGHAFYNFGGAGGTYFTTRDAAPTGTATGQLVVSSYDKATAHMKGTFSFKGVSGSSTKQFTNGTFDIYYVLGL